MAHTEHNPAVAFHDELAERWDDKYTRASFSRRADTIVTLIGNSLVGKERWLDAGCGTGTIARRLAQQGRRVTAVDGSPRMIEVARRVPCATAPMHTPQFVVVRDIVELPFSDGSFDGIVCSSVLEYVDDPARVLSEFARVLRAGGRLVVSVPNTRALLRRLLKAAHWSTRCCGLTPWPGYLDLSKHEYTQQAFADLVERCGFAPGTWTYYGPGLPQALSGSRYGGSLLLGECVKIASVGPTGKHPARTGE